LRRWALIVLGGWGVAAGAQTTERIGRVELSNGYVSVEARSDGLLLISAVSTLRFDFASGLFSPRTTNAWIEEVSRVIDSVKAHPGARIGSTPSLFSADRGSSIIITFELSPAPGIAAARFERSDGVQLAVAGFDGDSSLAMLLGFLRRATARTVALTLASPDSARLNLSDGELTGRTTPKDSVRAHPPVKWGRTDRMFVVAGTAGLGGIAGAYVNGKLIGCRGSELCHWSLDDPGFIIGSVAGSALGGMMFSRGSQCSLGQRVVRSVGAAIVGGMPGVLMSRSGAQSGLSLIPVGQAILTDIAMRQCRQVP
jgi:hypothetical protein